MKSIELAFLFFSIKHCLFYLFILLYITLIHYFCCIIERIQCIYFIYHLCRASCCFQFICFVKQCCKENSVCALCMSFSLGWLAAGWGVIPRWYWINAYLISLICDGLLSRKSVPVYISPKAPRSPIFQPSPAIEMISLSSFHQRDGIK